MVFRELSQIPEPPNCLKLFTSRLVINELMIKAYLQILQIVQIFLRSPQIFGLSCSKDLLTFFPFSLPSLKRTKIKGNFPWPLNFHYQNIKSKIFKFYYREIYGLQHCVKGVSTREFFWSIFSRIWPEYGEIWSISPY